MMPLMRHHLVSSDACLQEPSKIADLDTICAMVKMPELMKRRTEIWDKLDELLQLS